MDLAVLWQAAKQKILILFNSLNKNYVDYDLFFVFKMKIHEDFHSWPKLTIYTKTNHCFSSLSLSLPFSNQLLFHVLFDL